MKARDDHLVEGLTWFILIILLVCLWLIIAWQADIDQIKSQAPAPPAEDSISMLINDMTFVAESIRAYWPKHVEALLR